MLIYTRLEGLIKSTGIKKKKIADALDREQSIFQAWRVGKSSPNEEQLKIVADILGTTPAYLTGKTDEVFPIKKDPAAQNGGGELDKLDGEFISLISDLSENQRNFLLSILRAAVRDPSFAQIR